MGFKWVIGHLNRYRALGGLPVGCLQVDCRQRSFHLAAISINGHPGSIKNVFSLSCHGSLNQSIIIFPPHKQSSINLSIKKNSQAGNPPAWLWLSVLDLIHGLPSPACWSCHREEPWHRWTPSGTVARRSRGRGRQAGTASWRTAARGSSYPGTQGTGSTGAQEHRNSSPFHVLVHSQVNSLYSRLLL